MDREITTLEDLYALPGFDPNYLMTPEKYLSVAAPVVLPELVGRCQVLRKDTGKACGQWHKLGYALNSSDGVCALVGSTCGPSHFGVQAEALKRDIRLADNKAKHAQALDDLAGYQANSERHCAALKVAISGVEEVRARVQGVKDALGRIAKTLLQDAAKLNRPTIDITGVVFPNADIGRVGRTVRIPVGSLAAHEIGDVYTLTAGADRLRKLWRACREANLLDVATATPKAVREANASYSQVPASVRSAEELVARARQFLDNDFVPLCYLVEREDDRVELAYQARRLRGKATREEVRTWLQGQVDAMKRQSSVDRVLFNDSWRGAGLQVAGSVPKGNPRR